MSRHIVETPQTSVSPTSIFDSPKEFKSPTYPPTPPNRDDALSISSFASTSSRKARPESLIIAPTNDPLVLGVALVDFNHLVRFVVQFLIILSILDLQVGPRIEYSRGEIFEDPEVSKILPFLALPDGAHLVCASCNVPEHIILIIFRAPKITLISILSSLALHQRLYSAFRRFRTYWFHIFAHGQQMQPANSCLKPSREGL